MQQKEVLLIVGILVAGFLLLSSNVQFKKTGLQTGPTTFPQFRVDDGSNYGFCGCICGTVIVDDCIYREGGTSISVCDGTCSFTSKHGYCRSRYVAYCDPSYELWKLPRGTYGPDGKFTPYMGLYSPNF